MKPLGTRWNWTICRSSLPADAQRMDGSLRGFQVRGTGRSRRTALGPKRLVICNGRDSASKRRQEARLYSYKVDARTGDILPLIEDKHNHGWDAVRYSLDGYIRDPDGL